jgi:hypothetical protein
VDVYTIKTIYVEEASGSDFCQPVLFRYFLRNLLDSYNRFRYHKKERFVKKTLIPLFSLVLVFTLLFSVTSSAAALPPPPPPPPPATPGLPDPVVTPVSGDMEFSTELLPISKFPGTTEFNQMLVPVGFPAGEAQYESDGVIVSGMDNGKATACFYITGTQYGWGGKVGFWNGTKWVKLTTTITALEESNKSLACATITGNGTYAFIRYVADASLLPVAVKPACTFGKEVFTTWFTRYGVPHTYTDMGIEIKPAVSGTLVNLNIIPVIGTYSHAYPQSLITNSSGQVNFTNLIIVTSTGHYEFLLHYVLPSCYFDWRITGDNPSSEA